MANKSEIEVKDLDFFYAKNLQVLKKINLSIDKNTVTTIIGPSGCGKSTFIRCFNRLHDLYPYTVYGGQIVFKNKNILAPKADLAALRTQVGMVFQEPSTFPMSIFENVAYGIRLHGINNKKILDEQITHNLQKTALWEEVKDKLHTKATNLSLGQQQRLSIARAIALNPEVLLFDEPTSALDPVSTAKIEDLINTLKKDMTIVMVTHNLQQALRISDKTALIVKGELVEVNDTQKLFSNPIQKVTSEYIQGMFN